MRGSTTASGWVALAYEEEHAGKIDTARKVIEYGCERWPESEEVWLEAARLHDDDHDEARTLLSRSVEINPTSVHLWLALARRETAERAKDVLNKARKANPTSHRIWIAAAQLLEQEAYADPSKSEDERNTSLEDVDKLIEVGMRQLKKHQVSLTREQWIREAEKCEYERSPRTSKAIVKAMAATEVDFEEGI